MAKVLWIPNKTLKENSYLNKFNSNENTDYNNPVWHIHRGIPPKFNSEINFNSLINLVNVSNSIDKNIIWGFIKEYDPTIDSKNFGEIDRLIQYAINYYTDFVLPKKEYLKIDNHNKQIFEDIYNLLQNTNPSETSEEIQTKIYEIGKKHNFQNLRDFFKLVYKVLLGQEQGPRLGSFFKLYGLKKILKLLEIKLSEQKNE